MIVVPPIALTETTLTTSNVVETDYSEWVISTAYVVGNNVMVSTVEPNVHKNYECLVDSTGVEPWNDDGTNWLDLGPTNRWAMFDQSSTTQTENSGNVDVTITPGTVINSFTILNVLGLTAQLIMTDRGGVELVTNGSFDSDLTGWNLTGSVWTWASGLASMATSTSYEPMNQTFSSVIGKTYELIFDISNVVSTGKVALWSNGESTAGNELNFTEAGTYSFTRIATATTMNLAFARQLSGASFDVDNISIKEVTTVYDKTINLISPSGILDWWAYYFSPIERTTDAVFRDMPNYGSATVRLIIDNGSDTAKIGAALFGIETTIGSTNYGTSTGIKDYSTKETDSFGNFVIVQRAYSKRADYLVTVDSDRVAFVQNFLTSLRATPAVYIGNENFGSTIVYGYYRRFDIVISSYPVSDCNITLEGLT